MTGIIGKKIGMTQLFDDNGNVVAVTVVQAGPCPVTQVRTLDTDGYEAVQLAFEECKDKHISKPELGHLKKAGLKHGMRHLVEFDADGDLKIGDTVTVEAFAEYLRVLRPNGLLLLHVSNRNLDLQPVVAANALKLGLRVASKTNAGEVEPEAETSEWMVICRPNSSGMDELVMQLAWQEWKNATRLPRPWTDSYSNILGALSKW